MNQGKPPLERPLRSRARLSQWLFPILLELAPIVEPDIIIAIGLLWAVGLTIASATLPWSFILSMVVSFLVAFCLGCLCIVVERGGLLKLLQPAGVLSFFGLGLALSVFSLAGDCIVGALKAPTVSWLVACTEKAGIGFGITAFLFSLTGGITIVALLRLAVRLARNTWF
jgi:hypothetical protein